MTHSDPDFKVAETLPEARDDFAVIESMLRIELRLYPKDPPLLICRIWRNEEDIEIAFSNEDLRRAAESCFRMTMARLAGRTDATLITRRVLLRTLGKMPRVNAVEIVDECGNGAVVYSSWP